MASNRKLLSHRLLDLWGDNTPHHAADFVSGSYVNHQCPDAGGGTSSKSLEEWQALVSDFHAGFSDVKMEVLLQVAEGNYVCSRWRITATHTGPFKGIEGTGRTSVWTGVHTDRYEGDTLAESWVDWDKSTFLEGLGLTG